MLYFMCQCKKRILLLDCKSTGIAGQVCFSDVSFTRGVSWMDCMDLWMRLDAVVHLEHKPGSRRICGSSEQRHSSDEHNDRKIEQICGST